MPSQACQGGGSFGIGDGVASFGGTRPPRVSAALPLCDLLYSSWGGSPPFGAADMQMYERWRCRTLALRSLSCPSAEGCYYPLAAPTDGQASEEGGPQGVNTSTNKLDKIEEEEARRAEGFLLLRRCLPKGLPMDLVERIGWAECVSFFCKRESFNFLRNRGMSCSSFLQPVSLPSLVARLAHRLWFLSPGGPLFFPASFGGSNLLEALPPWVSFLCEELAAFFLFVLLHMKAIIQDENGVYVHLTDREWSARFRQLKWLLSFDSPLLSHPSSAPAVAGGNRKDTEVHSNDKTEMAFQTTVGERSHLDLPPMECIDTSLSEHFPMNPQSAPHSFWLLFDRRSFSWVVCTESYALRSFPVLDEEGAPIEGAPLGAPPSEGPPGVQQRKKKPLPSLVDAAREDALQFLCLLGAVPPTSLSGNTAYLSSLYAEEEITETPPSQQQEEQQQEQLLLPEAAHAWTDGSPVQSEATPRWDCEAGLEQEEHKRRESEGPNVDLAVSTADEERVLLQLQGLQPAAAAAAAAAAEKEQRHPFGWAVTRERGEAFSESSSKHRGLAAAAAAGKDSSTDMQLIDSPLSSEGQAGEFEEQTESSRASQQKLPQKRKTNQQQQQQQHKRRKKHYQQQQTKQQQQQQTTTKPQQSTERQQQQQQQQQHKKQLQQKATQQRQQHKKQQQQKETQQQQQHKKKQEQQHSEKQQPQQHKKQQHGEKQQQQQHSAKQQQQHPRLQQLLGGLLQGGRKQLCGGRVLVGLRHRNSLLDTRLVTFCCSLNKAIKTNCVTEQECLVAVQGYLQQHCERQKKVYLCDEKMKTLTGRERLPHQREALGKALKMAGLIEHFMIDPKDLKEA